MYESSPRSREVANAIFQIDRLTEDQTRAVLRHLAIDDAIMNEAQCSHIASLISGTLHKVPREGVNAALTCGTSLDAASHWERSFASHPGHVSATFRKNTINHESKTDHSKQMVLFKPESSTPAPPDDVSTDVKPSVGFSPDLNGLSIINQGSLTLHYHSYNDASSPGPERPAVSRKRSLDKAEGEEYSEALASLLEFDLSPESRRNPLFSPKRRRLEESDIEMLEPGVQKAQKKVKEEEGPAQKKGQKTHFTCKNCGKAYSENQNRGSKKPCNYHHGKVKFYPSGVNRKGKKGKGQKLYCAWSCCKSDVGSAGCVAGKHERDHDD